MKELELKFKRFYSGNTPSNIYSAPGRTEIGGNHTDHQHGKVLAAAIDLVTYAAVSQNRDGLIRIYSEGYDYFEVNLNNLNPITEETGSTKALVRGVAAKISQLGHTVTGFDAYVSSDVLPGSGLSSSAAFEVLIGTIINDMDHCGLTPVEIAQIGQYAENVFFGKSCGLMDQTASSMGNMICIDFADTANPLVKRIDVDFAAFGHSLCIIDSGADHANLTDEYASITDELAKLCSCYEKYYLRDIPEDEFYRNLARTRRIVGDRPILRAMHVYAENRRVSGEVQALESGDFEGFLRLVNESGKSSWTLMQNITPTASIEHQDLAFALAICEKLLDGKGACRVHGGGFGGTIQAFVPNNMLTKFKTDIESYIGEGSCHVLNIRREGGIREK